ncbi:86_t:CDS:2 [Paraglomus occultum]|uniref:86_t:CDS:1 n=1 Tax=Paraglomus occultum TaxID=144539 RepID=A0A9N8WGG0_9GLOM|nr:86_t:CDS:2 [Paraglomus occultum]
MFKRSGSSSVGRSKQDQSPENQKDVIVEFRKLLGPEYDRYDDATLSRFATARSFQLQKAKQQLDDTAAWRAKEKIDSRPLPVINPGTPILYPIRGFAPYLPDSNVEAVDEIPAYLPKIYKYFGGNCLHKTDKEGRAIYIERAGYHDAKQIAKNVKLEELLDWHISCQEFSHRVVMPELSRRAGTVIDKETVILDCEGMGMHQIHMPALSMYRAISDLDQKYYPERLGKLFIVNTPRMFVMIWNLAKSWLDPGLLKKISICGKDFQSTLLEHIDAENLPSFLGGNCTCSHMPGGCVPSVVKKNIPPISRSSLSVTQTPSRPSTPVAPSSEFPVRVRLRGGCRETREVLFVKDDKGDTQGKLEIKFRIIGGAKGVNFDVRFIKLDENPNKEENIVLVSTSTPNTEEIQYYKFETQDSGEFVLGWSLDESKSSQPVDIECSLLINGEIYGD